MCRLFVSIVNATQFAISCISQHTVHILLSHKKVVGTQKLFRGENLTDHLCYAHARKLKLKTKNCSLLPLFNNKRPGSDLLYMCHGVSFFVNWRNINKKLEGANE